MSSFLKSRFSVSLSIAADVPIFSTSSVLVGGVPGISESDFLSLCDDPLIVDPATLVSMAGDTTAMMKGEG